MQTILIYASLALSWATFSTPCEIPTTPLSDTIPSFFRIQVQNASEPEVHNLFMNLLPAGGGDNHLFVGPVGNPTSDLILTSGSIEKGIIHAVIGGEFSEIDQTTKMFTTERGDPRAIFAPTYACNPDTDKLQIELRFVTWQNHPAGGWICVRPTFQEAHEFRYYPPGNSLEDPNRRCIKVTLVVIPSDGDSTSTTLITSTIPSTTSSSPTISIPSSTTVTSATSTATGTPLLYTDMTSKGFAFVGCAPEERRVTDAGGRTLPDLLYAEDAMTNEKCMDFCSSSGFKFAGSEWNRECWCGNSYLSTRQPETTLTSLANCNYKCSGDASQYCGGDAWLSLYQACTPGSPCINAEFV
ncbi:hypothetical protein HYFRA_00008250 [Hymenoscyphus fraxineus]|uniref:WSC domain-containing protein n=1 Tax=Hymenoscyphus fraxineus TaxID=746836 RepID=A0A9N9PYM7_9HELO|nr:hypothetical protein HYFRA_00008250 [Hymenoscyphus fraxineus]